MLACLGEVPRKLDLQGDISSRSLRQGHAINSCCILASRSSICLALQRTLSYLELYIATRMLAGTQRSDDIVHEMWKICCQSALK